MTGRKNIDMTEDEKEHEYVLHQKRSKGDMVVGDEAKGMNDMGAVGEVAERRREWQRENEGKKGAGGD